MLFVHNEKSSLHARAGRRNGLPPHSRQQQARGTLFDTVLDTFHVWEGTTRGGGGGSDDGMLLRGTLPSGRMSVDFMCYETKSAGSEAWSSVSGQRSSSGSVKVESGRMSGVDCVGVVQVVEVERGKGTGEQL